MDVALELAGVDHELSGDLETACAPPRRTRSRARSSCSLPRARATTSSTIFEERGEAFKRLVAEVAG